MSKKQWMALLMIFLVYLFFGAAIFHHIERAIEEEQVKKSHDKRVEINELLNKYCPKNIEEILEKLTGYCGKSVYNYTENEEDQFKWDFYNSFHFAYTVVSTIGYGNLAPTTMSSRILMIFYALLGIPMNGILLGQLGEFFSGIFIKAYNKYKSCKDNEGKKNYSKLEFGKSGFAVRVLMYLTPGFVVFIFFPALVISYFEEKTYDEAVYYAFVTLTTIGFGDIVAGQDNTKFHCHGIFYILYKIFLIVWIVFGLGYMVMIISFITRGMRSKKIVKLERKFAVNLKKKQTKIWCGLHKDVNYLRRIFNELQLSKVKRIYVDQLENEIPICDKPSSSNSFPDLRKLIFGDLALSMTPSPRRRANSETISDKKPVRTRVVSETDLQRIDKEATFATCSPVQRAELLARLINILEYIPPPVDDDEQMTDIDSPVGIQGFSDDEILSSEHTLQWTLGSEQLTTRKPRSRTVSEARFETKIDQNSMWNHEWTWSGPAASKKIKEILEARKIANKDFKEQKSIFPVLNLPKWFKILSNSKKNCRTRNSVSAGDVERGENFERFYI
ncbi:open rectifier potassium channel protein 1-like [Aphidius gifuensis]|uniref:open rectifier potassium channel protein 1-like n=1 Tax=Aphidius gifuensis TaxID=684658 RepID=UPI001CDD006C|nr:open rectifier potassium channel protein 1-like [Aphidius gifuensis]